MNRSGNTLILIFAVILMSLLLQSCGGEDSGSPGGTGTLELSLTDAATTDFEAIYVTIAEVQVSKEAESEEESSWETIMMPGLTYNLLELVNGVIVTLGVGELEVGQYEQMRLVLGDLPESPKSNIMEEPHPYANYFIDGDGNAKELKVPSGYQTGIKIVKSFIINASLATELILDFDAARSVVQAGRTGEWLLKPTIKVLKTVENSISGLVDNGVDPLAGALISAQVYNSDALDPQDEVVVETTTVSTEEGTYKSFLPPDIYNIVVTQEGYLPACQEVEAQFFENYVADFSLTDEPEIITIKGTVSGLAADEDAALLTVRMRMDCGSGDVMVDVASIMVAEGGIYELNLPAGTYDLVASSAGEITQVFGDLSADTELDITFGL